MKRKLTGGTVLGLEAEARGEEAEGPVVMGSGRDLRGRVVVTDEERQRVLFPPPSEATIESIREMRAATRPNDYRLGLLRFD